MMSVEIKWDAQGLVPAIVQDAESKQVLMLAYVNAQALEKTLETGFAHFWSRERKALWKKGETSGNIQRVREVRYDCDADALLLLVEPRGPACHTGEVSCFYRSLPLPLAGDAQATRPDEDVVAGAVLDELFAIIESRKSQAPAGSYTARLLAAGEDEIIKKVGEEAVEVIVAAKGQGDARLVAEVADLVYHTMVLLAARGLTWQAVEEELARRRRG